MTCDNCGCPSATSLCAKCKAERLRKQGSFDDRSEDAGSPASDRPPCIDCKGPNDRDRGIRCSRCQSKLVAKRRAEEDRMHADFERRLARVRAETIAKRAAEFVACPSCKSAMTPEGCDRCVNCGRPITDAAKHTDAVIAAVEAEFRKQAAIGDAIRKLHSEIDVGIRGIRSECATLKSEFSEAPAAVYAMSEDGKFEQVKINGHRYHGALP